MHICDEKDKWIAAQFHSFQDIGRRDGYIGVPIHASSSSAATDRALVAMENSSRSGERCAVFLVARLCSEPVKETTEDTYVYDSSAYVLSPQSIPGTDAVKHSRLLHRHRLGRVYTNDAPMPQDIPVFIDSEALRSFMCDTPEAASLVA